MRWHVRWCILRSLCSRWQKAIRKMLFVRMTRYLKESRKILNLLPISMISKRIIKKYCSKLGPKKKISRNWGLPRAACWLNARMSMPILTRCFSRRTTGRRKGSISRGRPGSGGQSTSWEVWLDTRSRCRSRRKGFRRSSASWWVRSNSWPKKPKRSSFTSATWRRGSESTWPNTAAVPNLLSKRPN